LTIIFKEVFKMALYLVQHGKSLPKNEDPEQGLSEQGRSEVVRIAEVAGHYGVAPGVIYSSGKKRARQTADILAAALKPANGCKSRDGLKPLDDVTALEVRIMGEQNAMLVGHLPFMENLTAWLTAGRTDITVFKFQNGGIVCLDKEHDKDKWFIKWTLMPTID
jgi:phosphohistidine phosphatase